MDNVNILAIAVSSLVSSLATWIASRSAAKRSEAETKESLQSALDKRLTETMDRQDKKIEHLEIEQEELKNKIRILDSLVHETILVGRELADALRVFDPDNAKTYHQRLNEIRARL